MKQTNNKAIRLSDKQKEVIKLIRSHKHYYIKNAQNPTVKSLLNAGLCCFSETYDSLVLTESGKTINID